MKIGDSIEIRNPQKEKEEQNKKRTKAIIIVIVISIVIGIGTFFIFNSLIKNDEEEIIQDEKLSLNDDNVSILYQYVTNTENGIRYGKLVNNETTTIDDFKDEDKFFYALQFAGYSDFEFTGEKDKENNKIYTIPDKKIKEFMIRFFGPNIKYSKDYTIKHEFDFSINGYNIGTLKYNEERDGYDAVFNEKTNLKEIIVEPYYTKIDSAVRKQDGKIIIKEKIIYTKVIDNESTKKIELYKDPKNGILLENRTLNKNDKLIIDMDEFTNTGFIEYTFALNDNIYYFESCKFTY